MGQVKAASQGRIFINELFCWTDSEVALFWIKGKGKCWRPWVENRVVNLRKVVDRERWFHVSGVFNPADIPTRVCSRDCIKQWFDGPEILHSDKFEEIKFDVSSRLKMVEEMVHSELKRKSLRDESDAKSVKSNELFVNISNEYLFQSSAEEEKILDKNIGNIIGISRYSSLNKLINVTSYVLRFVKNIMSRVRNEELIKDTLSVEERDQAVDLWIKYEQDRLRQQSNFKKLYSSLKLFEDSMQMLRLKGRFGNTLLDYEQKYPIILRGGDSSFTKLLIEDSHGKVFHKGVESTLNCVRSRFWICQGRKSVKAVLRKCIICKRYQGRPLLPSPSPDLPDYRVNISSHSFQVVGLDYAGPLLIKTEKDTAQKAYILLFTCATSRAIHLELTPDMLIPSFLRGFKRFSSRRGMPDRVISDNFKTFKANEVKNYFVNHSVKQSFILPVSPWWGGFYERLVRSVKLALKKRWVNPFCHMKS